MNRILLFSLAGVAATAVAATPAVAGLSGNRSFSHNLPVRVPVAAHPVQFADEDHRDRGPTATPASPLTTSPTPSVTREPEAGDDRGTDTPTGNTPTGNTPTGNAAPTSRHEAEPGDDHHRGDHGDRNGDGTATPTGGQPKTSTPQPTTSREPEPGDDRGHPTPTTTSLTTSSPTTTSTTTSATTGPSRSAATLAPSMPVPTTSDPDERHGGNGGGGNGGGDDGGSDG